MKFYLYVSLMTVEVNQHEQESVGNEAAVTVAQTVWMEHKFLFLSVKLGEFKNLFSCQSVSWSQNCSLSLVFAKVSLEKMDLADNTKLHFKKPGR